MYTNTKNRLGLCLQTCWDVLMHVTGENKKSCKTVKVTLTSHFLEKF